MNSYHLIKVVHWTIKLSQSLRLTGPLSVTRRPMMWLLGGEGNDNDDEQKGDCPRQVHEKPFPRLWAQQPTSWHPTTVRLDPFHLPMYTKLGEALEGLRCWPVLCYWGLSSAGWPHRHGSIILWTSWKWLSEWILHLKLILQEKIAQGNKCVWTCLHTDSTVPT